MTSNIQLMTLDTRYNPAAVEDRWYAHWMDKGYFKSTPDDRTPFSIVIPPPNVTGVLHMGHILNNTIQDVLIRRARMKGFNACWVPGTDHASIATEAKVVRWLREEKGLTKGSITREKFVEYAWEWTHRYGGIILKQLQKLGASADWDRLVFTMDDKRYQAVIRTFIDLYKKGKLYRGNRMVNWDPVAQTVLSNEEVIYHNESTKLVYLKYYFKDNPKQYVTIATTRPETILGDTAIAVHPEDERYLKLQGKQVLVPLINRPIPVLADDYVDLEFGTGALKITPAHDPNDFEIGQRHNLEIIDILNADGTLNEAASLYIGEDRTTARKKILQQLDHEGYVEKIEDYTHNVGRSERTNAVIEPRLSLQWYVNMKSLAEPALKAVLEDEIRFIPENLKNTYRHWMENIRDWCISRQLWWGQRIPAYYLKNPSIGEEDHVFVAESKEEALQQAIKKTGKTNLTMNDIRQDDDVLDTWFSSWLWPISVFDGFDSEKDVNYYYPTNVLVTGWDIIFLWVARMIMSGYEYRQEKPFKDVYFTGMVRDKQRRKMSKSLGNSPDALKLIEDYGADGVRFGILASSPAGGDLLFEDKLVEQGRNFCNKIWNACRLVKGWSVEEGGVSTHADVWAVKWMQEKIRATSIQIEEDCQNYRLSDTLMKLYSFIWDDFCSWYLEIIKPKTGVSLDQDTYQATIEIFADLMKLLHPFMPFITEEIWHLLSDRAENEDIIIAEYPQAVNYDQSTIDQADYVKNLVGKVRDEKNKNGLKMRHSTPLFVIQTKWVDSFFGNRGLVEIIKKLAHVSKIQIVKAGDQTGIAFIHGAEQYFLDAKPGLDVSKQKDQLLMDIDHAQKFLIGVEKKLKNEKFITHAPVQVVEKERKKLADGQARLNNLKEELSRLSKQS